MEFCNNFCCYGKSRCKNLGKHFINYSKYHRLCDDHIKTTEYKFKCFFCGSFVQISKKILENNLMSEQRTKFNCESIFESKLESNEESHENKQYFEYFHEFSGQSTDSKTVENEIIPNLEFDFDKYLVLKTSLKNSLELQIASYQKVETSLLSSEKYKSCKRAEKFHDIIYQNQEIIVYYINKKITIRNQNLEMKQRSKSSPSTDEIDIYKTLSDRIEANNCFLKVYNYHEHNYKKEIFLEYYAKSLHEFIYEKNRDLIYSEMQLIIHIFHLLNSFCQMEELGIYHQNISLDSILVRDQNTFKIFDFSKFKKISNISQEPNDFTIANKDIKSLGMVLLRLALMNVYAGGTPEDINLIKDPWLKKLLNFMIINSNDRPITFRECFKVLVNVTGFNLI